MKPTTVSETQSQEPYQVFLSVSRKLLQITFKSKET